MKQAILLSLLLCSLASAQLFYTVPGQKPMMGTPLDQPGTLTDGLVGCWLMNEGSGTVVQDLRGNGPGTIATFGWAADTHGPCLRGTSGGTSVSFPYDFRPLDGAKEFSVIVACRPDAITADRGLFYTDTQSGTDPLSIWLDNAATDHIAVVVNCSGGGTGVDYSTESAGIVAGNYYHIVVTYRDGDGVRLYINGIEDTDFDGSGASGALNAATASGMYLGNDSSGTHPFYGLMDHASISTRALSPSEIASLYRDPWAGIQQDPLTMYATAGGEPPEASPSPVFQHHYEQMRAGVPVALPILTILSMAFLMRRSKTCGE